VVATARPGEVSAAELARLMVGTSIAAVTRDPGPTEAAPRLEVRNLTRSAEDPFGTALAGVSLAVHGGEIVGIAGVSGNGQRELLALLGGEVAGPGAARQGADPVLLDGVPVGHLGAAARRALGLAFVPEERLGRGAVPDMTLAQNGLLTGNRRGLVRRFLVDRRAVGRFAGAIIERFGVVCRGISSRAASLSGGNLQKFIVGREMSLAPRVLIVAQPTWGVDIAASAFLRQSLVDLSRRGAAVLVVSEELEELFEICDRIAVIYRGRLSAAGRREATSIEEIGMAMAGIGAAFETAA
jgi:simple sugar transport system ATP-binding protein